MKLGIMQPYFFPYLGYFDLIRYTDRWILFDTVQYIRRGWVNRNRVLHPKQSWQYVVVPIRKHSRATLIQGIATADSDWKQRLLGQLEHYRRRAPYFRDTRELVRECFNTDEESLARINGRCLQHVCAYLGIEFQQEYLSDMRLELGNIDGPGDWALEITKALGFSTYVNPIGG